MQEIDAFCQFYMELFLKPSSEKKEGKRTFSQANRQLVEFISQLIPITRRVNSDYLPGSSNYLPAERIYLPGECR